MSQIVSGCSNCQKPYAKLRCGKCKLSYYCDKECQKENWKVHKNVCQDLKEHEEQKDDIVKNFVTQNQELYKNALMMSKFLGNHSRFVVFTKNKPEQKDICYMTEADIRKSITPPEI